MPKPTFPISAPPLLWERCPGGTCFADRRQLTGICQAVRGAGHSGRPARGIMATQNIRCNSSFLFLLISVYSMQSILTLCHCPYKLNCFNLEFFFLMMQNQIYLHTRQWRKAVFGQKEKIKSLSRWLGTSCNGKTCFAALRRCPSPDTETWAASWTCVLPLLGAMLIFSVLSQFVYVCCQSKPLNWNFEADHIVC